MRVAVVEDDANIRSLLKILLEEIGCQCDTFENGWLALDHIAKNNYQLIVLDIMLPGINGIEICRKIRQTNSKLPILFLSSRSDDDDKIEGLESGADDYLTKPFSNGEFQARVKSVLRRANVYKKDENKEYISIGDLTLSVSSKQLYKSNVEVVLTSKEFELLQCFMTNPGRNFTRFELLERIWGDQFEGLEHTVNSNINRLRAKIEDNQNKPTYLLTVWGIGYKFNKNPEH